MTPVHGTEMETPFSMIALNSVYRVERSMMDPVRNPGRGDATPVRICQLSGT